MICLYHDSDLDGFCSGAIVKFANPDCHLYPANYGKTIPWGLLENEIVVLVDFCFDPFDQMLRLEKVAKEIIWIDHHKSTLEDFVRLAPGRNWKGNRRIGIGACALAWEYFFPETSLPESIRLLAEYDVWNHSDPRTLPFQYGMRVSDMDPRRAMSRWLPLFGEKSEVESLIENVVRDGRMILTYQKRQDEIYARSSAFEVKLEGHSCVAINAAVGNSKLFDAVWAPENYDFMIKFGWKKDCWKVTLYTTKTDISAIDVARKFGGGGHPQAAGFVCKKLPFILPAR